MSGIKVTLDTIIARAETSITQLKADASAKELAAAVAAVYATIAYEVGIFIRLIQRDDAFEVSDAASLAAQKRFSDALSAIDALSASLSKSLADNASVTDLAARGVLKTFTDSMRAADARAVIVSKALADGSLAADAARRAIDKALQDSAAVADAATRGVIKSLSDELTLLDSILRSLQKSLVDSVALTDARRVELTKALLDAVNATDDLDGALSAEDDQEVAFFKSIQHTASVGDELTRQVNYVRSYLDVGAVGDQHSNWVFKIIAPVVESTSSGTTYGDSLYGSGTYGAVVRLYGDASYGTALYGAYQSSESQPSVDVLFSDTIVIDRFLGRSQNDALTVTDLVYRVLYKGITDEAVTTEVTDVYRASLSKPHADLLSVVDTAAKFGSKSFGESVSLSDSFTYQLSRSLELADAMTVGDARFLAYGKQSVDALQISDANLVLISKGISESVALTESIARSQALGKVDVVSVASAGTLRSQGYGEASYFAEDYVGSSRSFT